MRHNLTELCEQACNDHGTVQLHLTQVLMCTLCSNADGAITLKLYFTILVDIDFFHHQI